jgi:hypothetical protein
MLSFQLKVQKRQLARFFLNSGKKVCTLVCTYFSAWNSYIGQRICQGHSGAFGVRSLELFYFTKKSIAKYCRQFYALSGERRERKGCNCYWASVSLLLEVDIHHVSVASSSLGRLTYAFCFYSRNVESQVVSI